MPRLNLLLPARHFSVKQLIPKSLFARALLILLVPLILVQVVLGYIFFDRHTDTILRQVSSNIAGDVALVQKLVEQGQPLSKIQTLSHNVLDLSVEFLPQKKLEKEGLYRSSWLYSSLGAALEQKIQSPFYLRITNDDVFVDVATKKGVLRFSLLRKRLFSRTTPLVLIWTTASALLLFIVASLFMRNQVRPIRRLAEAAERFGRGDETVSFKPGGAEEVRKAGFAFQLMQDRIRRHLSDRLEMLASVSHDLRTPLTRMKLQLSVMSSSEDTKHLQADVDKMQQMLDGFLTYAQGVQTEAFEVVTLGPWLEDLLKTLETEDFQITLDCADHIKILLNPLTFNRCLTNLILNSKRYSKKVILSVRQDAHFVEVFIEDDGPGIPLTERENVFKPFYRLESERPLDDGGVGLGLTIARDSVRSHGGQIYLRNSSLGGLKVVIRLPL